ncbi:MAG: hypothetical protein ACTHMC_23785 [Pseudobacter sp.]|uniref:hypothetical protein n=1 Tax=Pseudobacter sp. TaxID=2045420 RepID=UPI003F8137BF
MSKGFYIDEKNARKFYPTASPELKAMLEETFTKEFFSQDILERINSVADACYELGLDPEKIHEGCRDDYQRATRDIETVATALSEGAPYSKRIWYPWFYNQNSSSGFRFGDSRYDSASSVVGARLKVDSEAKSDHMAKILEPQYRIYITGEK